MIRPLYFALAGALVLGACDGSPLAPSDLFGERWRLVSLKDGDSTPVNVADPGKYTVHFEGNGRVAVTSDCNSCGGTFSLSGDELELRQIACTKVFCGDQSLDAAFIRALEKVESVTLNERELTIRANDGTRLTFAR